MAGLFFPAALIPPNQNTELQIIASAECILRIWDFLSPVVMWPYMDACIIRQMPSSGGAAGAIGQFAEITPLLPVLKRPSQGPQSVAASQVFMAHQVYT